MGFFNNIDTKGANKRAIADIVFNFLMNVSEKNFGIFPIHSFNGSNTLPNVWTNLKNLLQRYYIDNDTEDSKFINNEFFRIEDDLTVAFTHGVLIHDLKEDIPFNLSVHNSICLAHVDDKIFDMLPESLYNLWINNACRSNGDLSFKNLKTVCEYLYIVNNTKLTSIKGLKDVVVGCNVWLRYNKKLTSTEGLPSINFNVSDRKIHDSRYDNTGLYRITNNPVLEEVNIPKNATLVKVFIDESNPKINKLTSLPEHINLFWSKCFSSEDVIELKNNQKLDIDYLEISDFKGQGKDIKAITSSTSTQSVKAQLKKIVDDIKAKHWRVFDDLYAVLSFYNLEEYAGFTQKSRYLENGMIHSYDPEGELYAVSYRVYAIRRNSIKNGVCRYLNQLGVKYKIINTGTNARSKKTDEYIKIEK